MKILVNMSFLFAGASSCPVIAPPANGRVLIDGLTVTYTCNPGYTLNGSVTRTCEDDGTWSLTAPTCESKHTIPIHNIFNIDI